MSIAAAASASARTSAVFSPAHLAVLAPRGWARASGAAAVEKLGAWLERGVSVTIFPEGTRSEDGSLGAFKHGAFRLAIAHGRPIVPVVLTGAHDLLPKGSIVFKRRAEIRVTVLDPIPTHGLTEDDVPALTDRTHEAMRSALAGQPLGIRSTGSVRPG